MTLHRRSFSQGAGIDQTALLHRLQAVDFAIQDTVLYLDAYQEDKEALDYYHSLIRAREEILSQLPGTHPLTIYENTGDAWDWAKTPWPWESEAN